MADTLGNFGSITNSISNYEIESDYSDIYGDKVEMDVLEDYKAGDEDPRAITLNVEIRARNAYIPEKIIYNGITTVCIFRDGEKITARPTNEDNFDKEVGVAMCIMKRVYGSRSEFQRQIENAYDQNEKN